MVDCRSEFSSLREAWFAVHVFWCIMTKYHILRQQLSRLLLTLCFQGVL
jgi:hypothetical protein